MSRRRRRRRSTRLHAREASPRDAKKRPREHVGRRHVGLRARRLSPRATPSRRNDTVANMSLMALGSSAPEIMLNVLDILLGDFFIGDLGPSTIVGSAAFNLMVILAICVMAVDEPKKIDNIKVRALPPRARDGPPTRRSGARVWPAAASGRCSLFSAAAAF